ncbi:hypothetical protein FS837_006723 [Tulasnella sp. UAMH 9824]|nr:hypothetical protein FS837_006723 [Tulasnella sp. UAMH 9824]
MSCIIHRALALSLFPLFLLVSLGVSGRTVAPGRLPSLPAVVPSGVAPTFPILDCVLWQNSLHLTAKSLPPNHTGWAQPYKLRISGAPREAFSSHLNSFSTLKVTQHATTAFESRVTPSVLSLFSKADTRRLSSSPGATLSSPTSNTTASALPPRSHDKIPLSTPFLVTEISWHETPTGNRRGSRNRYVLLASLFATLVFSAFPAVLYDDTTFLHVIAADYSSSKQRIATIIEHYHVTIVWTEAQLTSLSKSLARVGQAVVQSFRFVGLLDRDIVSIGLSVEGDSLPPWPDFGEPDAEWPPSRRKARSRSYDSPYMDSLFIPIPWAENHCAETISTRSSRSSTPSPDQKTFSTPSSPPLSPPSPTANHKPRTAFNQLSIPYRLPDLTTEQLVPPRVWGFGNIPVEEWFEDGLPKEIKPYPWELPALFVNEEEEELEMLSKGYENDRLLMSFEANPKLLKRYLLDPQGFRDALPPPKQEDDSWKLRDTSDYVLPRLPKMERPFRRSSWPVLDERSTSQAGALSGASKIKSTSRKILSTVKDRRFGFLLQPKDKAQTDAGIS